MGSERCPHCGRSLTNFDFSQGECLGCGHEVSRDGDKPQKPTHSNEYKYSSQPAYESQQKPATNISPHEGSGGNKFVRFMAIVLLLACLVFLGLGIEKLTVYEYTENRGYILEKGRNAYVDDDVQNRIINTNYATAYFVLAGFSGLCSTVLFVRKIT